MVFLAQVGSFHNVLCSLVVVDKNNFNKKKDSVFFLVTRKPLINKWHIVSKFLKHLKLKFKVLFIDPPHPLEFKKYTIDKLKKTIIKEFNEVEFHITNFNEGILFNVLRNIYKQSKIFLIDDGSANTLKFKRKKKIIKKIQSKILNIQYDFRPKYGLGLKNNYVKYYTALDLNHIKFIKNKCVSINFEIKNIYNQILEFDKEYFGDITNDSCLICTHHSVDSDRLSLKEYEKIIIKIKNYMKENYHITNFYYVKHPAESDVTSHIYTSQNFIPLEKYNSEIYIHSNRIKYCVHPNNSIPIVAESIMRTNVKYFNYHLPNAAYNDIRSEINSIFDSGIIN